MQLQRRLNRVVGDKEYSKWQVVIPPETVEKLGWKEGQELDEQVQGHKLILSPVPDNKDMVELARQSMLAKHRKPIGEA
ncbi:hypothetical protein NVIE_010250 [Nitrososphaera viennensis EN76]|uniref:SpoVT-AbrB domain-containing protein n=1 Tax=Nitrososphaera viennensis EN76 TaxID=926571 RepID=A0A060HNV6_9ARCH|nr:hypothetical protein NVIE_010250 [Nitrososphaera viennensis EN76]